LFRTLKQLEDIVPLFNTVQCPDGGGWWFKGDTHKVPGTEASISFLHELYALADPHYTGRVSVPTIWDAEKKTIVSNESSEIIRMFNSAFAEHTDNDTDYYPAHLRGEIDAMNAIVLAGVNDAVNGCGRSKSQIAYDESYDILFSTFDRLEDILSNRRYLCGNVQTEADWRLFPSLFRFDSIYYIGYKCNKQRIEDYPNLSNYLRDLYQTPGIAEASDLEAAKICIYAPGGPIASNGIVPKGPNVDFSRAHDRGRFEEAA